MKEFTLSIFDPNTLLPHRAGIAGLALALSVLPRKDAPLTWESTDDAVKLAWDGSDYAVVRWLLEQTYQITSDGYLKTPALKLDDQGHYTFTQGVLSTFLQHNQQRKIAEALSKSFLVDEGQPEIQVQFRPLLSCYYTRDFREAFDKKGFFNKKISLKSHHLPGLDECFVNGAYQESPEGFLALLFLPIACGYYKLPAQSVGGKLAGRSAVVIPNVTHLTQWVRNRQNLLGRTYRDFRSSGAGESALHFLLQEKTLEDAQQFRVDYCEVYQLGKQSWNPNQFYIKQAVYRVQGNDVVLELYDIARQLFPAKVKQTDEGETWLAVSKILPWICDNLVATKPWYQGFFEFRKRNGVYERKGLVKMTEYLNAEEQVLFDAVQGSFSYYLAKQFGFREGQLGRELTKEDLRDVSSRSTEKAVNRLQRPTTQYDFAKALVEFLSDHPTNAMKSVGPQIYHWIHREANWRQARDLTLLAIATYTSKKGDALDGAEVPIESVAESDSEDAETFSMSV